MEVPEVGGGREVTERTKKSGSGMAWKRVTWRRNRFFSPVPIINKKRHEANQRDQENEMEVQNDGKRGGN